MEVLERHNPAQSAACAPCFSSPPEGGKKRCGCDRNTTALRSSSSALGRHGARRRGHASAGFETLLPTSSIRCSISSTQSSTPFVPILASPDFCGCSRRRIPFGSCARPSRCSSFRAPPSVAAIILATSKGRHRSSTSDGRNRNRASSTLLSSSNDRQTYGVRLHGSRIRNVWRVRTFARPRLVVGRRVLDHKQSVIGAVSSI